VLLHVVSFREQSIQIFLAQVADNFFLTASHYIEKTVFLNNFPE
jgi:hypothetical protein